MITKNYLILVVIGLLTVMQTAVSIAGGGRVIIRIPISADWPDSLIDLLRDHADLLSVARDHTSAEYLADTADLVALEEAAPGIELVKDEQEVADTRIDSQYLTPSEVETALNNYAANYPQIAAKYAIGTSAEGRTIWALKISDNVQTNEDEPEYLFMGTLHGRDVMSTEVPMDLIDYLCTRYASDQQVRTWVNGNQIWVIPMVNVDGSNFCWNNDAYWAKNRRNNGDGTFGVNVNRNFPFLWGSCFGSSENTVSSTYRGSAAGSEPEVQAIMNLAAEHRFIACLSYQAFNEYVLYPYGCRDDYPPDNTVMRSTAGTIASAITGDSGSGTYSYGTWWERAFVTDGVETDWFYGAYGTYCFAVQLNASSYQPSYNNLRNLTVQRNRPGWQAVLNLPQNSRLLSGHIIDACSNARIPDARYWIDELPFTMGEEERTSDPQFGNYFYFLRAGTSHVMVEKEGYGTTKHEVIMGTGPLQTDIKLVPLDQYGLNFYSLGIDDTASDHDYQVDPGETAYLRINIYAPGREVAGVTATISTLDQYITILDATASFPDVGAGATAWSQAPHFQIQASSSTPNDHVATFTINFQANEDLCLQSDTFSLVIRNYNELCPYVYYSLDSSPNWTIQNSDANGWEYGMPVYGPTHAHTGQNVYGTNLDGAYSANCDYKLTTTAIDCQHLTNTTLKFFRFLQCEQSSDSAYVQVSTNGSTYTNIYHSYAQDGDWTECDYDISQYADGHSTVYIRWRLTSNSFLQLPGFYIDDVSICGRYTGALPPTYIPTVTPEPSFTPTLTPIPTDTPTATLSPTPTDSPTPGPTDSPTATPTITNTPIFSYTPTLTPTNTSTGTPATATPTPTPTASDFITHLYLNDTMYRMGDLFMLECELNNLGETRLLDRYIILDVFGVYWFYPHWTSSVDYDTLQLLSGEYRREPILSFIWPEGAGQADGIVFWAGCLTHGTFDVVGNVDHVTFGWQ